MLNIAPITSLKTINIKILGNVGVHLAASMSLKIYQGSLVEDYKGVTMEYFKDNDIINFMPPSSYMWL